MASKDPKTALQEDDEFEDFPVEDWPEDQDLGSSTTDGSGAAQGQQGQQSGSAHLWEESWDDDDATGAGEDFAAALRGEMNK